MAPKPPKSAEEEAAALMKAMRQSRRSRRANSPYCWMWQELSRQQNVDTVLEKIVDITFHVMPVDRVAIAITEPTTGEPIPRTAKNRLVARRQDSHVHCDTRHPAAHRHPDGQRRGR